MLVFIIPQVATPANITNLRKGEIIKTTPFEMVLIISPFLKFVIFAGVATCGIIMTSTVDLYLYFYSSDWFEVTQTTVVCLKW